MSMEKGEYGSCLFEQILRALWSSPESCPGASGEGREQACGTAALARFMDEMPGGFLIYRADRGEEIIYANRGMLRICQCDTMEDFRAFTGGSFRGLVHPEDLEAVEKSIWAQIAASQYDLDYVEYRIHRKDGTVRWIEDYGHFVHVDGVGDIFYVFLGDATEKRDRMLLERDLLIGENMEKEQRLQAYDEERRLIDQEYLRQLEVIEGLSINYESICYVDLDADQVTPYRLSCRTAVLFDGRQARSYLQYAESYVDTWVHPEDRELVARSTAPAHIREKLAVSRTYYLNYRVLVKGELQYLQLRLVNVGHGDAVNQVVLGYRRMDEELQSQLEQQSLLAEALAKANLAVNSKDTFLSNMSHDMRTPLHAVFGFTTLAKMNVNDPQEALGYLERVETAARQLLDMIEKVLEASSMSGDSGTEEVECDLREIVQHVYDFLQPQAQEKDIAFTLDFSGLCHSAVYADREKLRQLMLYLGNNAVTYTDPGGSVVMSVTQGEELPNQYALYRLTVKDTGIGISPEFLEKIFEPFSRERDSTLSGIHGVGLGLAIAKNIVDMMGGTLDVQSKVDEGSTFTAVFSFRLQALSDVPQRTGGCMAVRRILLVEDNELNRELETELLEEMGFIVDTAENGREALEKMQRAAPGDHDLVLMDIQMPVMDGWQATEAIRNLPDPTLARIPIIALSADMLERDRQRSKEKGIDAHLLKPMDLALLLRTIEEVTGASGPSRK